MTILERSGSLLYFNLDFNWMYLHATTWYNVLAGSSPTYIIYHAQF
jgi:hypothetical protein